MSVLVTGAAGFIGSHVVDRLAEQGRKVIALDDLSGPGNWRNLERWRGSDTVAFVEADVAEGLAGPLREAEAKVGGVARIVHLAAQVSVVHSLAHPLADLNTNGRGIVQVLEFARRAKAAKVVFASSAAVYGDVDQVPTQEGAPKSPLSPYGINKLASEFWLGAYSQTHGVATSPLRFFNVYGPRQDPSSPYSGVISIFIDRAKANRPITIFGDGEQTRDFVYVGDVVNAIVAALDKNESTPPINVGTGRSTSVNQLAAAVLEAASSTSQISHGQARGGEIRHSLAVVDLLEQVLGVVAQMPLVDGLRRTL